MFLEMAIINLILIFPPISASCLCSLDKVRTPVSINAIIV